MATRAALAARADLARQSAERSMQSIAAGTGVEVPPAAAGIVGKDPEMRVVADRERVAVFLAAVAEKIGKPDTTTDADQADEPAQANEPASHKSATHRKHSNNGHARR